MTLAGCAFVMVLRGRCADWRRRSSSPESLRPLVVAIIVRLPAASSSEGARLYVFDVQTFLMCITATNIS